jgi:hypothetical protein
MVRSMLFSGPAREDSPTVQGRRYSADSRHSRDGRTACLVMRTGRVAAVLIIAASTVACSHNTSHPSAKPTASSGQALGSLGCRTLPESFAASHASESIVRLSNTEHRLHLTMRPPPAGFLPGISGTAAFKRSGLDREPGLRFDVFLARVSSPTPAKHTVPSFRGQVFWVARGIRTDHPYFGLPAPVTSSDRQCASLAPPVAILTSNTGRHVLTGN